MTRQTCVTPEKLNRGAFGEDRKSCQRTIVRSTSSLVEIHEEWHNLTVRRASPTYITK